MIEHFEPRKGCRVWGIWGASEEHRQEIPRTQIERRKIKTALKAVNQWNSKMMEPENAGFDGKSNRKFDSLYLHKAALLNPGTRPNIRMIYDHLIKWG